MDTTPDAAAVLKEDSKSRMKEKTKEQTVAEEQSAKERRAEMLGHVQFARQVVENSMPSQVLARDVCSTELHWTGRQFIVPHIASAFDSSGGAKKGARKLSKSPDGKERKKIKTSPNKAQQASESIEVEGDHGPYHNVCSSGGMSGEEIKSGICRAAIKEGNIHGIMNVCSGFFVWNSSVEMSNPFFQLPRDNL